MVSERGIRTVRAVTEGTLDELDAAFTRDLERAGYTIVGSENEIVEADIYFTDPSGGIGGVKFVRAACEGRIVVRLFLDTGSGRVG